MAVHDMQLSKTPSHAHACMTVTAPEARGQRHLFARAHICPRLSRMDTQVRSDVALRLQMRHAGSSTSGGLKAGAASGLRGPGQKAARTFVHQRSTQGRHGHDQASHGQRCAVVTVASKVEAKGRAQLGAELTAAPRTE